MVSPKLTAILFGVVLSGVLLGVFILDEAPTDDNETPSDDNETDLVGVNAAELPAGITGDSVIESALINEHTDALSTANSYTLTRTVHTTVDGQPTVHRTRYETSPTGVRSVTSAEGKITRERYADIENGTLYIKQVNDGEPTYTVEKGRTISPTTKADLTAVFNGGRWSPERLHPNETPPAVSLKANRVADTDKLATHFSLTNVTGFHGVARVSNDQFIREVTATTTGTRDDANVSIRYESKIERIGSTRVPRPSWTEEADTNTTTSLFGMSGDSRSMFVSHYGGTVLEAGTSLDVYIDVGDTYELVSTTLSTEFKEGQTLYLTIVDGELVVYKDQTPDKQGDKLTAESYYIELTPPGESEPRLEFEILPPDR